MLETTPVRFLFAGTIGFVVDASVLHVLVTSLDVSPIRGRVASYLCASFVTWRINRTFTFRAEVTNYWLSEWLHYQWASGIGAAVNYTVYALLVIALPLVAHAPTIGVAAGSVAGMVFNYLLYKRVVFRKRPV